MKDLLVIILSLLVLLGLLCSIYGLIYHITLNTDVVGGLGIYFILSCSIIYNYLTGNLKELLDGNYER